jgi:hypothetical protein
MVHGNYYGIQYEIHLTREIDYYDELLPIWINVRAKIEMEKDKKTGNYKLIVIPYNNFCNQLFKNELFNSYVRENDKYSFSSVNNKNNEEYIKNNKFLMVRLYENNIRFETLLPEPITKEEFNQLIIERKQLEFEELSNVNKSQDQWREHYTKYNENFRILKVQRIIHDKEYFEEIKSLHKQLLDQIILSEEQKKLIENVLLNPKLEGIISWHGLTLVEGYY